MGEGNVFTGIRHSVHTWGGLPSEAGLPSEGVGGLPSEGGCMGRADPRSLRYAEIWSTGGQYASQWNAFLFYIIMASRSKETVCKVFHRLDDILLYY